MLAFRLTKSGLHVRSGASVCTNVFLKALASNTGHHHSSSIHFYCSSAVLHRNFRGTEPLNSVTGSTFTHDAIDEVEHGEPGTNLKYHIPQRVREKVISAEDAVALVRNGDTICVSGFVAQGAPELLLKALGERFEQTQEPKDCTLLFGGGPGDYGSRGLSHLAKISPDGKTQLLKRTIGG